MLNQHVCSGARSPAASCPSPLTSPRPAAPISPASSAAKRLQLSPPQPLSPQHTQPQHPRARSALFVTAALSTSTVEANRHNGHSNGATAANGHGHGNGHGNGHAHGAGNGNGNGHASGNGTGNGRFASILGGGANGSGAAAPAAKGAAAGVGGEAWLAGEGALAARRDPATMRVHVVVPRCQTVPGERLVLVGDRPELGAWDVTRGLPLTWSSGHMHSATMTLPAGCASLAAKLVLVGGDFASLSWEPGQDRAVSLVPAGGEASGGGGGVSGKEKGGGKGRVAQVASEYVLICQWGHTEASSVLAREVPAELVALEQQLTSALSELRSSRAAAAAGQERLQRMASELAASEERGRGGAEEIQQLKSKAATLTADLSEARRQAKAAASAAAAAEAAAAAAASRASAVDVVEVEQRVSRRYEGRMAELKQQLDSVKGQYSSEVAALQDKLEASMSKEAEAQEMVKTLKEIVQKDVARLRTELAQLVNEYIAARQQLQEQAAQIEASEKLRMQQIDGLSGEIKLLMTKYHGAQDTIAEQQRLLEELQVARGLPPGSLAPAAPGPGAAAAAAAAAAAEHNAGRDWRSDWARLRKMSAAAGGPAPGGR